MAHQVKVPEFNHGYTHGERKENTPESCPQIFTPEWTQTQTHRYTQRDIHTKEH